MYIRFIGISALCLVAQAVSAQGVSIQIGKTRIALNEAFTIQIVSEGEQIREHDRFPDLPGMVKRGTSSATSMQIANGQRRTTYSLTQNYFAQKEGPIQLPAFSMRINGKTVRVAAKEILVLPPTQVQNKPFYPFEDNLFGSFFGNSSPTEFVEVKADAFIALSIDKSSVYVGEGVHATLALYVSEQNQAELQFYDLGSQLSQIIKRLKPTTAWEENFHIEQIERENISLQNKRYALYKLYEATFYPINTTTIIFPSVGLKFLQYKVAKNPSFFGRNRQEAFKTFYTRQKKVQVKPLPPHPLRQSVAVGRYWLSEELSADSLRTGESATYRFTIQGEGNVSAIEQPQPKNNIALRFYTPQVQQDIYRANGRVRGKKSFRFYIEPQEAGQYDLNRYLNWIYFDPQRTRYDTLRPKAQFRAKGEHLHNQRIRNKKQEAFYAYLHTDNNTIKSPLNVNWIWVSAGFVLLIGLSYLPKPKKKPNT